MAVPADVSDVEARLMRPLSAAETIAAVTFLNDAWWLLQSRLPSLEQHITDGLVFVENARRVVANMVVRVLRNPEGWEDESVDDWRGRRSALVSSGVLSIDAAELDSLRPTGSRTARSVRLVTYGDA